MIIVMIIVMIMIMSQPYAFFGFQRASRCWTGTSQSFHSLYHWKPRSLWTLTHEMLVEDHK